VSTHFAVPLDNGYIQSVSGKNTFSFNGLWSCQYGEFRLALNKLAEKATLTPAFLCR
jgi:hypothetical protein